MFKSSHGFDVLVVRVWSERSDIGITGRLHGSPSGELRTERHPAGSEVEVYSLEEIVAEEITRANVNAGAGREGVICDDEPKQIAERFARAAGSYLHLADLISWGIEHGQESYTLGSAEAVA